MIPPEFYDVNLHYLTVHKELQESILRDIVRRIVKTDYTLTDTAAWQTEKLTQAGMLYEDILSEIAKRTDRQKSEIRKIFDNAELEITEYTETLSTPSGEVKNLSPALHKSLTAAFRKTFTTAKNLTKTIAVTSQTAYIMAADIAHQQVMSGAFTYDDAIRRGILSAAEKDMTVVYPSGHTDSLDVAMRRAVITGVNQTGGEIADMVGKELDYDLRELTAHMGARPEHAVWQGRIVSLSGRKGYLTLSDIGYGDVRGFLGANCRHNWYPFPEGGTPNYSDEELEQLANATVTVEGEEMPVYEALQKQRGYERAVRKTKRQLVALDEAEKNAKTPEEKAGFAAEFEARSVKLKAREARLKQFCRETGLDRDRTREQVFAVQTENGLKNFGKSTSGKAVWNAKKHYSDFVSVVGKENAPESLEKYYELKYNKPEEYKKLRELYKGFSSGELVRNASGQTVRVVKHVKITGEAPNTITQRVNQNGGIDRNYYDENGRQYKQISNNDHGHKKESLFGKHGEHAHDYDYEQSSSDFRKKARELTEQERKENADIL